MQRGADERAAVGEVEQIWHQVRQSAREAALLESIESLLSWDERTMLPPAGGAYRAEQAAYIAKQLHQKRTDPRLGEWLDALAATDLAADRHSPIGASLWELRRQYDRLRRLPESLVEELSRVTVLSQQAWVESRKQRQFPSFEPWLQRIVKLKREQAEAIGYGRHPYDALLDDYEPMAETVRISQILSSLKDQLVPFVQQISQAKVRIETDVLARTYPRAAQERFGRKIAEQIGFDFRRGRLDETVHPFCSTLGPNDCRITTRYDERNFSVAFFGILHEAGHGLYEQGLSEEWFGLAPGMAASLGIHESQSRLWENFVGRSHAFWQFALPLARQFFPGVLNDVGEDQMYAAVNRVQPSLIRVEADEATYNLHIIIRFELELALLTGDLAVGELPGAWNQKYRELLGIEPPDDAQGCLQDIHWSAGLIGYFPTYTLGNLYAAQLFEAAVAEIGDWAALALRGDFLPLLEWLRKNIHRLGRCYHASELVERATGQPFSAGPLLRHLKNKLGPLYGVSLF